MRLPKSVFRKAERLLNCLRIAPALVISLAILTHSPIILANDTIARIGTGGITFEKSEDIRMLEEWLEIELKQIRVRYRFLNESSQDIHTTVAFPLPSQKAFWETDRPPYIREMFIKSFAVLVDGHPVQIAYGDNVVYWQQSFPAQKETLVEHTYSPITGGRYEVPYQGESGYIPDFGSIYFLEEDSCLEPATKSQIVERAGTHVGKGVGWVRIQDNQVEYILGTGRNWKGPIGTFRLRIHRNFPNQFISVCFPYKLQQISSTTYEFVQRDFVPPDTLVVHYYTVSPSPHPGDDKLNEDEQRLLRAAYGGDSENVKEILKNGTEVNAAESETGWTPLIWAIYGGHAEIVKILLDQGASTRAKTKKGFTALKLAQEEGHTQIVDLLKAHGAKE